MRHLPPLTVKRLPGPLTERLVRQNPRLYRVGSVYYPRWIHALAAVNAGGTLVIEAGATITGALTEILTPNITIRGDDGDYPTIKHSLVQGKGALLISAPGCTVEHLRLDNIGGRGDALAAIRLQTSFFTGRDLQGSYCENFILGGGAGRDANGDPNPGLIALDGLVLDHCGHENGKAHAIYVGTVRELILTNSRIYDSILGHLVKSRAAKTSILDCLLRKGTASRAVDISNGGELIIDGCQFDQDTTSENDDIIAYAPELGDFDLNKGVYWKTNRVRITNNSLHNTRPNAIWFNNWLQPGPADKIVAAPRVSASIPRLPPRISEAVPVIPFTPGDAWWDGLEIGQVYEVANTKMGQVVTQFTPGFIDHGVQGWRTWMNQYSGAAFDEDGGNLYMMAGGHMASSNNCMLGFALETMTPRVVMQPSLITKAWIAQAQAVWDGKSGQGNWYTFGQGVNAAGKFDDEWPDGKPTAIHRYSNIEYLEGKVYAPGLRKMWEIDAATGIPEAHAVLNRPALYPLTVADKVNKVLVRCGAIGDNYDDIRTYNPVTREIVVRPSLRDGAWPLGGSIVGRELVCWGGHYMMAINLDTWAQRIIRPNYSFLAFAGSAWASHIGRYLIPLYGNAGEVGAIDLATGACSVLNLKGVFHPYNNITLEGPFSRFRYYPRRKTLVVIPALHMNLRIVKLA